MTAKPREEWSTSEHLRYLQGGEEPQAGVRYKESEAWTTDEHVAYIQKGKRPERPEDEDA